AASFLIYISTLKESTLPPAPEPVKSNLNFVGRQGAIADLNAFIAKGQRVILILGEGGKGKSTLAREFCKTFDLVLRHDVGQERQNVTSIDSKVNEWLRRDLDEESAQDFDISLTRLLRKLQDSKQRIVIWIDNLEPALEQGLFVAAHSNYVKLLRGLSDVGGQVVTLITSREQISEPNIYGIESYELQELQPADWHEFYGNHRIDTGVAPLENTSALTQMHNAYGGNAEAMSIFKGDICREAKGNLEAYWQENKTELLRHPKLANLIESQFNKLQQDSEWEYRLLCRMGCFRFQDVPYVPKQGLLELLWDAPKRQKAGIIKQLLDRCLIKLFDKEYFLHPVVRAEAISRLRDSEEWEITNRNAAQFWTDSIQTIEKIEEALKAFEAYYHYLEINDAVQACNTIIGMRDNKWEKGEALGRAFYRLGLLQPMLFSINLVIDELEINESLGRICNILGDIYWLSGEIHKSIEMHKAAMGIGAKLNLKRLEIASYLNLGLCNMDLWNMEEAVEFFREVNILAEKAKTDLTINWDKFDFDAHGYEVDSWFCLAFSYSCLGMREEAYSSIFKACKNLSLTEISLWSRGYALLFLGLAYKNLGEAEKSSEMYCRAIQFAEESSYVQVKAKALSGLAEIYQEQKAFERALSHHSEAVSLLDKIGAKCDFAGALFQRALTYQAMEEVAKSQVDFLEAIRLFTEMNAPRQVERVQQAIKPMTV
ncbi:MAG: hypothetical protein DCF22_12625, partial [Leptolyngbya sp.]